MPARIELATLPTPVQTTTLSANGLRTSVVVKRDDQTSPRYGGNKVRKLEYLFARARDLGARRVATFGAVSSNHALATSIFAHELEFACTALLAHQTRKPSCGRALNRHLAIGTDLICFQRSRKERADILRSLRRDATFVIPMGGTCPLGTLGFVDAGIEFAEQLRAGEAAEPGAIYVAMGTMGTVAGIALGLALAGLDCPVEAVRVTSEKEASPAGLARLCERTADLMRRYDPSVPRNLADRIRVNYRPEFYAGGYARSTPEIDEAVRIAGDELGLTLESTYTGKAFLALLSDRRETSTAPACFWNTYSSVPSDATTLRPADVSRVPEEFLSYFD